MKKIWLITLCTINLICHAEKSLIVSLGGDCEPAWQSMHFNLREAAFPFDWIRSYDFSGICLALQEQCCNFLNPNHLVYVDNIVKNTHYAFEFVHDFPTTHSSHVALENENDGMVAPNYLDYLADVNNKYERRITRLIDSLQNGHHIIFLRTDITPHQATMFVNMMTIHYPQAHYQLVVLHNNITYNYEWNIPHVIAYLADKKNSTEPNGWYPTHYWEKLFVHLNKIATLTRDGLEIEEDEHVYSFYKKTE